MVNSYVLTNYCPSCGSYDLIQKIEPHTSIHHARQACNDCGRFIKWIARPPKHQKLIDTALASGRVSAWENLFLRNIRTRKHLSPAQSKKFEQIISRHQIKSPVPTADTG